MLRILVVGWMLLVPVVALSQGNPSSAEGATREEARENAGLDGKQTGPGRPDDPGAHGRENAAQKQEQNPGRGSKGGDDRPLDDADDDRKDEDRERDREQDKDRDQDRDTDSEAHEQKQKQKDKNKAKSKGGKNKS
jgi:hypothetical protein